MSRLLPTRVIPFFLLACLSVGLVHAQDGDEIIPIEIDGTKTLRRMEANPAGFCMSYLTDQDTPDCKAPMADVVRSMRLGSLRYPMGTLAENYLFHDLRLGPPREGELKPRVISLERNPAKWTYATKPDGAHTPTIVDFDEFVEMYRQSGTEPVVLVASHGHLFPGSEFDEEDILRNAEEWVRYANVTRKLGIKYWEIGNEVDLKHSREVISKEEYLRIFEKIATRMKAVDPTIRTGLGTMIGAEYAKDALDRFPELVDFVVVHHYAGAIKTHPAYMSFNGTLLKNSVETLAAIDDTAPESRRKTTEILITEFSSYCAGSKVVPNDRKKNSILSAMITFEMLADGVALDDRVRFMHFWGTHSPWGKASTDYANALAPDNTILPQGRALEILSRAVQDRMVPVDVPKGPVRCWASLSENNSKVAIWLVNRTDQRRRVSLRAKGFTLESLSSWKLAGENPNDEQPYWGAGEEVTFEDGVATTTLPPLSITVFFK